jgi:hypothetical protein
MSIRDNAKRVCISPRRQHFGSAQLDNLYTTTLHQIRDILVEEYLHCSVLAETTENRSGAAIYLADDCYTCLLSRVCQLSVMGSQKRLEGEDEET